MKKYLIAWWPLNGGAAQYTLSKSRNAVYHCEVKNARSVEIYDKEGWLLSMARRHESGGIYRPKLFLDGEPRRFYAERYKDLAGGI